ncbi:hypothetical protein AEGHOMDF_0390 [Methylobacterium soli]|nr:hypothetical protein AEGHOMDF_0390 [Methylobacterium soli]
MQPTSFKLPILATPTTIVPKMTGASSILISLMKPSANGCSVMPTSGRKYPINPPSMMAMKTWTYSRLSQSFMAAFLKLLALRASERRAPHAGA